MPQPPEPTRLMNCDEPTHCVGSTEALWVLMKHVILPATAHCRCVVQLTSYQQEPILALSSMSRDL